MLSWYALDVRHVINNKITRQHDDHFRSRDQGSSLVYNEFMQAWVTYELVQVLHVYGLMPSVRSNIKNVSLDLFTIETFLRDRTMQQEGDSEKAAALMQRLFGETEHSAIFRQMNMGSMLHFKQLTTYAIPFLLITWLRQLEEHFFLHPKDDFLEMGMYTALSSRPKNTTTSNNIWLTSNSKKGIQVRVELLKYFKPKQRKSVCVTLREWAAFIFKCEFEPPSLDASSKEILNASHLKKRNTR